MRRLILPLLLLALLGAACTADSEPTGAPASPGTPAVSPDAPDTPDGASDATTGDGAQGSHGDGGIVVPDVSELVKGARPGVVAVSTSRLTPGGLLRQEVPAGAGTGIVIDGEGTVITNFHVIAEADEVTLTSPDGTERQASLVGASPDNDIAVLEAESTEGLAPLPLGDSDALEVGDPVIAIGNALALGDSPTVSLGIISAKQRTIQGRNLTLEGMLQTDAAINPGNSGGPLLDRDGRVVGINTAVAGGQAQNIGFAIPVDRAQRIIERIRSGEGEPFIGVTIVPNSPQLAARLGLSTSDGLVVADVRAGTPAAQAGLQRGDVLVAVDGQPVEDSQDLTGRIDEAGVGGRITLVVVRGERQLEVPVTVGEREPTL